MHSNLDGACAGCPAMCSILRCRHISMADRLCCQAYGSRGLQAPPHLTPGLVADGEADGTFAAPRDWRGTCDWVIGQPVSLWSALFHQAFLQVSQLISRAASLGVVVQACDVEAREDKQRCDSRVEPRNSECHRSQQEAESVPESMQAWGQLQPCRPDLCLPFPEMHHTA